MAGFLCSVNGQSYFVDRKAYEFQAANTIADRFPEGTKIKIQPIRRFVTIYKEYIDLEDGDKGDDRPVQISEYINGEIVSYVKEHGFSDKKRLYAIV